MQPAARIAATIELLGKLDAAWAAGERQPADALLQHYFKQRRYMGSKDRGEVARLFYGVLRNGGMLEWHSEQIKIQTGARLLTMLFLALFDGMGLNEIGALCTGEQHAPAPLTEEEKHALGEAVKRTAFPEAMPEWARKNCPEWMLPLLKKQYGETFTALMDSLNEEAPVDLRVNTLRCPDRAELIFALDKEGIHAGPTPLSPLGVRLKKRRPVFATQPFKDGWFEMQDEGSQLLAQLVQAKPGEKVIDFCAGAGGKTLAIAAQMQNKGRILAFDISQTRLKQMKPRLARAGVDNVQTRLLTSEKDVFLKRHKDSADWVLVDAPCTGAGTWRRNPDMKWRTSPKDLEELCHRQRQILSSAARLVKPGGYLVYATCSLFREENESQIDAFLVDNLKFTVASIFPSWNSKRYGVSNINSGLSLLPHQHGTDGFYGVVLQKSENKVDAT